MSVAHDPSWTAKLTGAIKADPKKTGILATLSAVLLVLLGRALLSGEATPAPAAAALSAEGPSAVATEGTKPKAPNEAPGQAMAAWFGAPATPLARNLFAVKFDYFPTDGRSGKGPGGGSDGIYDQMAKSAAQAADQQKEKQVLLENLQREAGRLRLQSIMMGPVPKAMIDGGLVGEGDVVASFRVLKVEPRRVIVEREGIKLEILMN